jgi:hypothetical protein
VRRCAFDPAFARVSIGGLLDVVTVTNVRLRSSTAGRAATAFSSRATASPSYGSADT